jgi:hypothetical protein
VPLSEITRITNDAPDTLVSVLGLSVSGEAGAAPAPAPSAEPAPAAAPSNDDEGDPMRKTIAPP